MQELQDRHQGETVCAVTHNFVILSVLGQALGLDAGGFRRIRHGVAAISVVDITGERAQVLRLNDACHLA